MSRPPTEPEGDPADRALDAMLQAERPVPPGAFRGGLARELELRNPGWGRRPQSLWPMVALALAGALVLLGLAAILAAR